jgi:hypothetical protein
MEYSAKFKDKICTYKDFAQLVYSTTSEAKNDYELTEIFLFANEL